MSDETPQQASNETAGSKLRAARIAKSLDVAAVATALRIRKTQIEAIENNDLDALPGMTYAVGFVKSYANYVGLNSAEIARQFKNDNNHAASQSNLSFPAPINENNMPEPMLIGIGAFLAVVLLVGWMIYSGLSGGDSASDDIQAPPVVAQTSDEATPDTSAETPADAAAVTDIPPPPADILPTVEAPATSPTQTAVTTPEMPVAAETKAPETKAPEVTAKTEPEKTEDAEKAEAAKKAEETKKAAAEEKKKNEDATINVKRGKTRVVLRAKEATWVQVSDYKRNIVFKKVLRPGEEFSVPDEPGMSLVTANAGGLDIVVDGQKAPALGEPGEIVRGIALDPSGLKTKKTRAQYN